MKKNEIKRIIFYTSIPRLFRTTLIGNLYEIAQVYPVILLSEKLDPETEKILNNKKFFPKLEEIISVHQYDEKRNLLAKNRYFCKLAKDVVQRYKPDIVMTTNDMYPFELYLLRFAKRIKAINVLLQAGFRIGEWRERILWSYLNNVNFKTPAFLPSWSRVFFIKFKKWLAYFIYYWVLPPTVGELPFRGKSSFMMLKGSPGMRDADYSIVFSRRDYDLSIKEGLPEKKLYILAHPLKRTKTRRFFEKAYFSKGLLTSKARPKTLTFMWPAEDIGFKKDTYSLISKEAIKKNRIKIITLMIEILKDWDIFIKPHPVTKNIQDIENTYQSISPLIKVINPQEPADKYIKVSRVVVGIPPASTTLFTASLQSPEKTILSLDLEQELFGDCYKDFDEIDYIDNEKKFINILKLIKGCKYRKRYKVKYGTKIGSKEFPNAIEMLNCLFQQKVEK